ncbi:unnamed protein product [Effrenium voratum]|nr:unnamed protein product [Effrenium voratum]
MMSSCDASSWRDVEEGQAEKRRRVSLPDASEPVDELPVGEEDTAGPEERFAAFADYVEDPEEEPPSDGDFSGHVVRWEPVNVTAIEEALSLDAVRRLENCDCFVHPPTGSRGEERSRPHPGAPARVSPRSRAAFEVVLRGGGRARNSLRIEG